MVYKNKKNNKFQKFISILAIALIVSNIFVTTVSVNYVQAYNPSDDSTNPNIPDPQVNPDGSPFDSSVQTPQVNADGSPVDNNYQNPQVNPAAGSSVINPRQGSEKTYTLLEPLPCLGGPGCTVGQPITQINLGDFFQYAFNLLIALSAVAAVFMMVYGGFLYMTSDAWSKKSEGLEKFKNAIYGLLMVLGAYLILRTVNPKLVAIPASIPKIEVPDSMMQSPLDLFNQLNADAIKYNLSADQAVQDAKQAKQTVVSLQQQKTQLQSQLGVLLYDQGVDESDPRVQDLKSQIAKTDSQIIDTKAMAVVSIAKGIMLNGGITQALNNLGVQRINGTLTANSIDQEVNNAIEFINTTRGIRTSQLLEMGAYDQVIGPGGVNDIANVAELTMKLEGINAKLSAAEVKRSGLDSLGIRIFEPVVYVGGSSMGKLNQAKSDLTSQLNTISTQIGDIKDPQLKQELQTKLQGANQSLFTKLGTGT